ncbi:MAG: ATP synthase F1 subunit gamma [Planctomycetes bacterium]|nr:ATP synthase F1 subunit gamma [Planctomycetota bacterium]
MANARDLLKRKKSVQNTCKITRTMELVASAKMKNAKDAAMSSRPYAEALSSLVNRLSEATGGASHELMTQRPVKNVTILIATSDRGLCGAFNGNIIRKAMKRIEEHKKQGRTVTVISLAKKVASTLKFFGHDVDAQHKGIMDAPVFEQAQTIIEPIIADFLKGDVDLVEVMYAHFESAARINPHLITLLPAGMDDEDAVDAGTADKNADNTDAGSESVDFLFHPDPLTLLDALIPRAVKTSFFSTLLQTSAGEHAARRQAMKNATDAANDLIKELNRDYNRARQGKITQEIAEIVGAVSAME